MSQRQPITVHRSQRENVSASDLAAVHGLAIAAYVDHAGTTAHNAIAGIPVVSFATWRERLRNVPSVITALDPATRRGMAERIAVEGGSFITLSRLGGPISPSVNFGEGSLVTGESALSINYATCFGRHVILMTPASVGHDCTIGDFVTIFPSAVISGYVALEDDVVLDVGSVIINGRTDRPLRIGRGARIEAGAVVTKPVPRGAIVAGNPGRVVRT